MMTLTLNGKALEVEESLTIAQLLKNHGYDGKLVAVAVNGTFTPKATYDTHQLQDKDSVEVVAPMQGG